MNNDTILFPDAETKNVAVTLANALNTAYQLGRGDLVSELAEVHPIPIRFNIDEH